MTEAVGRRLVARPYGDGFAVYPIEDEEHVVGLVRRLGDHFCYTPEADFPIDAEMLDALAVFCERKDTVASKYNIRW